MGSENKIKDKRYQKISQKRYQELGKPYRIILWLRYMPYGYIKGSAWYFIKRLTWKDMGDDEDDGRIKLDSCIGICIGLVQVDMRWYYNWDEVIGEDGSLVKRNDKKGYIEKMCEFIGDKIITIIDGKKILD